MERFTTWRVGLVACIALVVFALAPAVSSQSSTPTSGSACVDMGTPRMGEMGMMRTPGMGDMGMMMDPEQFDLMFIDMMIVHHEGAVAMARIALERGEHPEIIQLAKEIISAQEQEITQLTTWREAWYPDTPAFTMDQMMGGMDMMNGMDMMAMLDLGDEVARMCAASASFDLAFIDAMIPHHQSAIMMAEAAARHATHPEIQELSQAIVTAQTRELEQMEGWRDAWNGEATP